MNFGNKLIEETYSNTIEEAIAQLENIAPSNVDTIIENSKGVEVFSVPANYIQYIYTFGKYNILVDYNNDIFIDDNIKIVDMTLKMEY